MEVFCNYPEAELNTTMFVENITFYYGAEKAVFPIRKQILRNQQPGAFIVNNYYSEIYITRGEQFGILVLYLSNNWMRDTDLVRYFNLTNATMPILEEGELKI